MQNLEEVLSTIRSIGQMMEDPAFQELMQLANQSQSPEQQVMQQQTPQQGMPQGMPQQGMPQEVDPMEQAQMIGMIGNAGPGY